MTNQVSTVVSKGRSPKHGLSASSIYSIWRGIKRRCEKENRPDYPRYGGRGVRVCNEWQDFETFHSWAVVNGYADNLTIDRINSDGNYEPSNCRWIPKAENNRSAHSRAVKCLETGEVFISARAAAAYLGMSINAVSVSIKCNGGTCGGYSWEYVAPAKNGRL